MSLGVLFKRASGGMGVDPYGIGMEILAEMAVALAAEKEELAQQRQMPKRRIKKKTK